MMQHLTRLFSKRVARESGGFTLIETLVAITLLTIAVVAPISLTSQALSTAYYARDQITAFYLAQEAIEVVRSVRDSNVLKNALGQSANLMDGIPDTTGKLFTVDTLVPAAQAMQLCPFDGVNYNCPPLQTDGNVYGYHAGWTNTRFTRQVKAVTVSADQNGVPQEIRVSVTVSWQTGRYQLRTFTISEDMYRWVNDGSGA